jgi:hypothetical protein
MPATASETRTMWTKLQPTYYEWER